MEKVLALYMPVLHEGYRLFLEKNQAAKKLFLFDQKFLRTWPDFVYLKKDIRSLDSQLMKEAINKLFPKLEISVIKNQQDWQDFLDSVKSNQWWWVLSNDDLGRYLAKNYLTEQKISFDSYFLRWDRPTVEQAANHLNSNQSNKEVAKDFQPDQVISQESFEKEVMKKAFIQANYSNDWWRQVGAVFVSKGQVLLNAYNQHLPSAQEQYFSGDPRTIFSSGEAIELTSSIHAEALAIARAAKQGISLEGADLFVTTFPCPICAKQVAAAGIKRLYYNQGYAVLDGWQVLKGAGIEIIQVEFNQEEKQELTAKKLQSSNLKKRYS
jgi:dCMP deaminase